MVCHLMHGLFHILEHLVDARLQRSEREVEPAERLGLVRRIVPNHVSKPQLLLLLLLACCSGVDSEGEAGEELKALLAEIIVGSHLIEQVLAAVLHIGSRQVLRAEINHRRREVVLCRVVDKLHGGAVLRDLNGEARLACPRAAEENGEGSHRDKNDCEEATRRRGVVLAFDGCG